MFLAAALPPHQTYARDQHKIHDVDGDLSTKQRYSAEALVKAGIYYGYLSVLQTPKLCQHNLRGISMRTIVTARTMK